jgi:hypothetical protein
MMIINPIDDRTVRSVVEARREDIVNHEVRQGTTPVRAEQGFRVVRQVRYAVGVGIVRVGERIAGSGMADLPRLRPGV